jgi:FKBP-type peptidyl-prolyl cis-trans isomerase FklB
MKTKDFSLGITAVLAGLALVGCGDKQVANKPAAGGAASSPAIVSTDQKVSYGIGYKMGLGLARDGVVAVDQAALNAGLTDGLTQAKTRVPEADLDAAFTSLQQKIAAAQAAAGEKQLAAGREYLAKNKAKAGVKETASGLQYEVLAKGKGGPKPTPSSTVKVHYHGMLTDGTVFDSSVQRGQPIEMQVSGFVPGWIEALQLMSVGDKWKLTVPSNLAYGPRANGRIPANSVLVFEMELLGFK